MPGVRLEQNIQTPKLEYQGSHRLSSETLERQASFIIAGSSFTLVPLLFDL